MPNRESPPILNHIAKVVDCEHKTAPTQETGYPSIRTPNIGLGRLILDGVNLVSEETYEKWTRRAVPKEGDLIFAREAPAGNVAIVPRNLKLCLGQRTVLIQPDHSKVDSHYLTYLLLGDKIQARFQSYSTGATVGHLNVSDIRNLVLPELPSILTQRKIAAVLSAYDDLIENNFRRIVLLEEMARLLYREWFVHFRFPGHKQVKLVDSPLGKIPEGWEADTIGGGCQSLEDGDWIETKDQGGSDFRLLQVSNIGIGDFIETYNYRYISSETFKRLHCTEILPGDILISRMPKPTGRAWLVTKMPWRIITAVDVAIAKVNEEKVDPFVFLQHLNSAENLELVEKHQSGTTRPRIARRNLSALPLLIPPLPLQKDFRQFAFPSRKLITSLRQKNASLRTTRDLLLPKLISGEVDVADLEIQIPEVEAAA